METAQGHVVLLNAIVQSGLMDSFNYGQRKKKILVCTISYTFITFVCHLGVRVRGGSFPPFSIIYL